MTTQTWTTVVDQSSDAAFRTWGSEFNTKLAAVGLVQTADTGQINWTTVTRAAINSDAGYEVWRMNDTQQATAPIFLKIFYGSASNQNIPRIRIQLGTASNGSGTVSGTGSANTDTISYSGAAPSTVSLFTSYACAVDGAFWISWKLGAGGGGTQTICPHGFYGVFRSCDSSGVASADAVMQVFSSTAATSMPARSISFTASTIYGGAGSNAWWLLPYSITSSLVSGTPQIFKGTIVTPRVRPSNYVAASLIVELNVGVTCTATFVGSTSHTYLACASLNGASGTQSVTAIYE
jgi:hypothetical protein